VNQHSCSEQSAFKAFRSFGARNIHAILKPMAPIAGVPRQESCRLANGIFWRKPGADSLGEMSVLAEQLQMKNASKVGPLTRFKGGFRRMIETELGEEQFCGSCCEFWPADAEFFNVTKESMGYECKACQIERKLSRGVVCKSSVHGTLGADSMAFRLE
jgi:hypothetical protein